MKFLVLALCVCAATALSVRGKVEPKGYEAVAVAQVSQPRESPVDYKSKQNYNDVEAAVLRSESNVQPDGYNYVYETANGIVAESVGSLKKVEDVDVINVKGSYRYVAPDGTPVEFTYTADENGYHPQSSLLPVAPPVPEAIARSIQYIATHVSKTVDEKKY